MLMLGGSIAGSVVFDRLSSSLDPVASSESKRTERRLQQLTGTAASVVVLVPGDPREPKTTELIRRATAQLAVTPGVVQVNGYPSAGDPRLLASDGTASLITASVAAGLDDGANDRLIRQVQRISADVFGGRAEVAGSLLVDSELGATAESDLVRADAIAIPLVLVLLAFALRSRLAIALGFVSIVATVTGSLALIYLISLVTEVSVFAVNVVTMFALGLTVDYGLLFIGAFKDHRRKNSSLPTNGGSSDVAAAVRYAQATAGRTIMVSGLTVAAALTGLLVFREPVLRSLGFGGIGATLFAITVANTLLPAMLTRYGHTIAVKAERPGHGLRFERLAGLMQRRPAVSLAFGLSVLAFLAGPILGLRTEGLDIRSLPIDSPLRVTVSTIAGLFPAARAEPITIIADTAATAPLLDSYTATLQQLPNVAAVTVRALTNQVSRIDVVPTSDSAGSDAQQVVESIRTSRPGFTIGVTGEAAEDLDFTKSLTQRLPFAAIVIVAMTLALLWALTGSIVIPLKAVALSALSLSASIGALVWGFQHGHLAGLLNITPIGGLEPVIILLTAVFAFGLSTDYEVFLLAAILDARRQGQPTPTAISTGVRTTGRLITTAAALLIVVFIGFAAGDLLIIKQLGVGLIIAVALDATLVRLVLVPATLALLGQTNWWMPVFLRRLHRRLPRAHDHTATGIVFVDSATPSTDTP